MPMCSRNVRLLYSPCSLRASSHQLRGCVHDDDDDDDHKPIGGRGKLHGDKGLGKSEEKGRGEE
jgi:hypothetical protein